MDVMFDKRIVFYPHRRNRDGSFDSICLTCFATVAHKDTEAELLPLDSLHIDKPTSICLARNI